MKEEKERQKIFDQQETFHERNVLNVEKCENERKRKRKKEKEMEFEKNEGVGDDLRKEERG